RPSIRGLRSSRLIAGFSNYIFQRLACHEAANLRSSETEGAMNELRCRTRDVRGKETVWRLPQRMICGKRLRVSHVEGCPYAMRVQTFDERHGVDHRAT